MSAPRFPVRVGVLVWPQVGSWEQIREAVVAADRAGVDSIWTWVRCEVTRIAGHAETCSCVRVGTCVEARRV